MTTTPAQARPAVVVVVADGVTLTDVLRPDLHNIARLRATGVTALMSPGLPVGSDPAANVYASLGAGDAIRAGDVSQGLLGRTLAHANVHTALIGDANSDDTGAYFPAQELLPAPDFVLPDGTVRDGTAPGGRRVDPARLWTQTQNALRLAPLVVVQDGDFLRLSREQNAHLLMPAASAQHKSRALHILDTFLGRCAFGPDTPAVFLLCPPAPDANGKWDSLTPAVWHDGRQATAMLGRTDTTQTPGLMAARDAAPTVLLFLHVLPPVPMTGAALTPVAAKESTLSHLDRVTRLNQQAQNPLFWGLGFAAAGVLLASVALLVTGRAGRSNRARQGIRYGLRVLCAWPLALLIIPAFAPPNVALYLTLFAALTFALAWLPTPTALFSLTALVLIGDALTGTRLVAQSVLSAYALSGIRFYGIGNEYMGVLLGGTLLLATVLRGRVSLLVLFGLVTFALSFPAFGAKAGGAVTALVTFTAARRLLTGESVKLRHMAGAVCAGFLLVFIWAAIQHNLPGARRTHLDTATAALAQGRFGYIGGVAVRKVGLAVRVFLHPGTQTGLLGLGIIAAASALLLGGPTRTYLEQHPRFRAVWNAGAWGVGACVLFNDSGVVAAVLLAACGLLPLLHGLAGQAKDTKCDLSRWTWAKFGSGWRSVTRWKPLPSPSAR